MNEMNTCDQKFSMAVNLLIFSLISIFLDIEF